ncbi:hypothetical protein GSbR_37290 [Geobacter sp. SVR]|nr:hypothetical protein GSVR_28370 [Geobacter sp. SVR]GCF87129.1 hypothetical protein GSbR_37290 [Geobacter sp. SVR]
MSTADTCASLYEALSSLQRVPASPNPNEITGLGPVWACANFGAGGHDYGTCGLCHRNYDRHIKRDKGDHA